ncbi:MAG TPA: GNAT family N-acetyltransferase [Chloroflexia bacterium]|jgi:GNAT superfamily N-acetyltransferase
MEKLASELKDTIALLDELAANAWPAPVQQQLEGWKLRAAGGVTRRANSVYTSGEMPHNNGWLSEVQDFYARQALPVRFQVSDGSPHALVPMLDALGYSHEADTEVQAAPAATVAARSASTEGVQITTASQLEESWLEAFMQVEEHNPHFKDMYRTIMSAIGPATRFAQAQWGGETVGVGMAVSERGWTGLFNLATDQHMRGRGIATAMIADLAGWSIDQGAERLYLQVMSSNQTAKRLYAKLGFTYLYGYHYRTEPGPG